MDDKGITDKYPNFIEFQSESLQNKKVLGRAESSARNRPKGNNIRLVLEQREGKRIPFDNKFVNKRMSGL